jgi:hypothetical protein
MSFKIGAYTIERGALIPYTDEATTNQGKQIDGNGGVVITETPYTERYIRAIIKVSTEQADYIDGFLTNGVRFAGEYFTLVDGFGVSRNVRFWDKKVKRKSIASGIVQMDLLFRLEIA